MSLTGPLWALCLKLCLVRKLCAVKLPPLSYIARAGRYINDKEDVMRPNNHVFLLVHMVLVSTLIRPTNIGKPSKCIYPHISPRSTRP